MLRTSQKSYYHTPCQDPEEYAHAHNVAPISQSPYVRHTVFTDCRLKVRKERTLDTYSYKYKRKNGQFHPRTSTKAQKGERRHTSTLSSTSALNGVAGQLRVPAALTPVKGAETHRIGGWVGHRGRSGRVRKISPPQGFDPRTA